MIVRRVIELVILLIVWICLPSGVGAKEITVCLQCDRPHVNTIDQALRKSEPGDTIKVVQEPTFPILLEHIIIDKPVRLISEFPGGSIEVFNHHPILSFESGKFDEIIRVVSPGVIIEGFNLDGMGAVSDPDDDSKLFATQIGIKLEAPATIRFCKFNRLRTAILAQYKNIDSAHRSAIEFCQIGEPTSISWQKEPGNHPCNFYGIILLSSPKPGDQQDKIYSCKIIANRYYGVVYTLLNPPSIEETIIEMNQERPFRIAKPESINSLELQWIPE